MQKRTQPVTATLNEQEKTANCRHVDDCAVLVLALFDNDCVWNMNEQERRGGWRGQASVETWQFI